MKKQRLAPVHPGEYLKELIDELNISQYRLAQGLGISTMRINFVIHGKRPVTAELALRLGRYFGQHPRYWINLQSRYDLDIAEDGLALAKAHHPHIRFILRSVYDDLSDDVKDIDVTVLLRFILDNAEFVEIEKDSSD